MLCNKQMQQPNATNKVDSILPISTGFYRSPWLRRPTARPALIPGVVAPRLRETITPRIPAQRSRRSPWNTTLLDIEQISSYYKNKNTRVRSYKEAHQHGDTMPAILHLHYASSRTTWSSGILLVAEQRWRWWTPLRRDSGWDTI